MRIFYAADSTPNSELASSLWRENLYRPLVSLGHDVIEFDYDLRNVFRNLDPADPAKRRFIERTRPRTSAALLEQIRAAHARRPVDLFFSYFYDACILPGTVDAIRALGIKTINWFCNGAHQLHLVSEISPRYDWCLVPEKFRLPDYAALGARAVYCQEAANPEVYRPEDVPVEFDVTFVGQAYGERPEAIRFLLQEGIDIRVWGQGWSEYSARSLSPASRWLRRMRKVPRALSREGGRAVARALRRSIGGGPARAGAPVSLPPAMVGAPLSDREMIRTYSRSRINLGFSACGDPRAQGRRILQVRLRDFEVPMAGGFYLVEHVPELEEFFEIGTEIVCYTDTRDMADKIKYYLAHEREREQIRIAGHARARRDHSWQRRFQKVFEEIGLEPVRTEA